MHVPARQRDASKLQLTATRPTNKLQLRPRTTTSSERRRTFRALQREREEALVRSLTQLSEEIQSLQRSQQLHRKTWLHTRHRPEGSCARAIHEFFTVFADGLETDVMPLDRPYLVARVLFKEQYLRYLFDPDVVIADDYGLQVVIDQWRRFTALHSSFCIDMGHIDTMGPREDPTYLLYLKMRVRFSLKHVFPSCIQDERLRATFLHRLVVYDTIVRMRFTDQGRINYYAVDIDIVSGLMRAGGALEEIVRMRSTINSSSTIVT